MNERIKEFRFKAAEYTNEQKPLGITKWNEMRDEKFAELIVRECEKVIRAEIAVTDISGEVDRAWEMGMECGVYTIKEHFGVEE